MPTRVLIGLLAVLFVTGLGFAAQAQQEFAPPQGKGRVVVMLSGIDGARPYEGEARRVAKLGYDVILIDSTSIPRDSAPDVVRAAIAKALNMPHALPGKVALVGYFLGGGRALQSAQLSEAVAAVIVWYPATTAILDQDKWTAAIQVPILMFAGEDDVKTIGSGSSILCCSVNNARTLAAKTAAAGKPFELVTYPATAHGFIAGNAAYKSASYADASKRMDAKLAQALQ
jgi:dienelactone hydrolase